MSRLVLASAVAALLGACSLLGGGEEVLDRGVGEDGEWVLTANIDGSDLSLELVDARSRSGGSGYEPPGTVNEAGTSAVEDDGAAFTLIYGPVAPEAEGVRVESTDGVTSEATLADVGGWRVFWVRMVGEARIRDIVATNRAGDVVDRWTHGDSPPPPDLPPVPPPGFTPPGPPSTPS